MEKYMTDKSKIIAQYNDAFRADLGNSNKMDIKIPGKYMMSHGISTLNKVDRFEIMLKVKKFDDFNEDNNPHGEHDMGKFQHNSQDVLWKIDYYDANYEHGSEDPVDLSKTRRILTAMLSYEY